MSRRSAAGSIAIAALAAALLLPTAAQSSGPGPCGLTTLNATVVDTNGDGVLECGPGLPLTVREDLAAANPGRAAARSALAAFFIVADLQLADEESPLRGEWADKCEDHPFTSAFRPHETLVPHLTNAHVLASNAIAAAGSPVLGEEMAFAIALGDLADNAHYNETRGFIDLFDGAKLVDHDSGADGYDGIQGADPKGGTPALTSPTADTLLDLANEPFWAAGFRRPDGSRLPWYSVAGNHDIKVQGTIPDDNAAWRAFARAWAVGSIKVMDLAPDHQQALCDDPSLAFDGSFWMQVAANPGTTKVVPADPDRRMLDRSDWIAEHSVTTGLPTGHGFAQGRCTDATGATLERACYAFDSGPLRIIVLDTAASEGIQTGNLDAEQFAWLERELAAASTSYYGPGATPVANPSGTDKLIVIATHHTISSTTNTGPIPCPGCQITAPLASANGVRTGADLKALLLRFPNVILQASGHTHQNKIWAHTDLAAGTGYWEVNTSAIVDWPTQSRTIEIADNGDGTLSIFAVTYDAAAAPDPRTVSWAADPTDETIVGAARSINEDWLASAGREVAFNDPQADATAIGSGADRNVELLIDRPFTPSTMSAAAGTTITPVGFAQSKDGRRIGPGDVTGGERQPEFAGSTSPGIGDPSRAPEAGTVRALLLLIAAGAASVWLRGGSITDRMLGR